MHPLRRVHEGLPGQWAPSRRRSKPGLAGLWAPVLRTRLGYCEYHCTLCGQVCPTGAIPRLTPADKERTFLGLAWVDTGRCLPYAFATPCIVCEEHCPTSPKAIRLVEVAGRAADGTVRRLRQPDDRSEALRRLRGLRVRLPGGRHGRHAH